MKFYNRKQELQQLGKIHKLSQKITGQFTIISGRRRVGKSKLINQFTKNKKSIYFFVTKKKAALLLNEFSNILNDKFDLTGRYDTWDDFVETLFKQAIKHKTIIVFDEFQNFNHLTDFDVFGVFQKVWDKHYENKNLNLIVAGSLISLMEKIFSNQKEPLYGRATQKIKLEEFDFKTINEVLRDNRNKGMSLDDLLNFYTVFGGYPFYYAKVFGSGLFKKNIVDIADELIVKKNSPLNEEGRDILIQEFGSEHVTYFSVLEAVAKNRRSFNKIAYYTKIDDSFLARALNSLENNFKLIKKELPDFSPDRNLKKYFFDNKFLSFWFRYVYAYPSSEKFASSKFKKELDSLKGHSFELLCREFLINKFKDFPLEEIGNYWDKKGEIDLILDSKSTNKAAFVECKISVKSLNQQEIDKLKEKSLRVGNLTKRKKIYIFMFADKVNKKSVELLKKNEVSFYDVGDIRKYLK